jgi:hypothetical protein
LIDRRRIPVWTAGWINLQFATTVELLTLRRNEMTTAQAKQLRESAPNRLMATLEQGHSAALKQDQNAAFTVPSVATRRRRHSPDSGE